jgi:hypothetical protein
MSFIGLAPAFSNTLLALALLGTFPLGGFTILLLFRVGRTYRVGGNRQLNFVIQRAPKALRRAIQVVFGYSLIHFLLLFFLRSSEIVVPLAASALAAAFYLVFMAVFTVGLGDPRLVGARASRVEQKPPLAPQ